MKLALQSRKYLINLVRGVSGRGLKYEQTPADRNNASSDQLRPLDYADFRFAGTTATCQSGNFRDDQVLESLRNQGS
jgi:hypothetical protein